MIAAHKPKHQMTQIKAKYSQGRIAAYANLAPTAPPIAASKCFNRHQKRETANGANQEGEPGAQNVDGQPEKRGARRRWRAGAGMGTAGRRWRRSGRGRLVWCGVPGSALAAPRRDGGAGLRGSGRRRRFGWTGTGHMGRDGRRGFPRMVGHGQWNSVRMGHRANSSVPGFTRPEKPWNSFKKKKAWNRYSSRRYSLQYS